MKPGLRTTGQSVSFSFSLDGSFHNYLMKPSKYEERKTLPVLVLYCPYYLLPSTSRFDGFSAAVMLLSWDHGHRSSVEGGGRSMTIYPLATKRPTRQPIRTLIQVFSFAGMKVWVVLVYIISVLSSLGLKTLIMRTEDPDLHQQSIVQSYPTTHRSGRYYTFKYRIGLSECTSL